MAFAKKETRTFEINRSMEKMEVDPEGNISEEDLSTPFQCLNAAVEIR